MQGLMERHNKLSSSEGASKDGRRDSTTRLMETATKMMKNGVTPDVMEFIETTITEINTNILGVITDEYTIDQDHIDGLLQRLQDASDAIPAASVYVAQDADRRSSSDDHKVCRKLEALKCAECRRCESILIELWEHVKITEIEMRRLHDSIHGEWCLADDFNPNPPTPDCWNWPEASHWEGPETSQSLEPYCVTDVSTQIRDFRQFTVYHFERYIEQWEIVKHAWEAYSAQQILCAQCDDDLEDKVTECDGKQTDLRAQVCHDATESRMHRRTFGENWHAILNTYYMDVGDCRLADNVDDEYDGCKPICDVNAVPHDDRCKCTGILQEEQDRKREWETLHIVTCLLETVYTHVVHAIETEEPCPTITTHTEQVESEINYCHVVERSFTANLTHHYCVDRALPYNVEGCLPVEPPLPPVIEPPCTSQYIWEEQGFFSDVIQQAYNTYLASNDLQDFNTALSEKGWAGCAAPLVCVPCEGLMEAIPDLTYSNAAVQCKNHEDYLRPGQNNGETFKCLSPVQATPAGHQCHGEWHSECVPAAARCNGHSECADGSDEEGCTTLWGMADLRLASTDECRAEATHVPNSFDDVQFFCASGDCTSIEARCNGVNNCADGSDEAGCPTGSAGLSLEATTGFAVSTESLSTSSRVFHDREYNFDSLGSFAGMTFIKTSNEDKHISQSHVQMKLRLPRPMTVYVAKLPEHELQWLHELGPDGMPLWHVSDLQGASYSGMRLTRQTDWIMGAPADYNHDHEDWAHLWGNHDPMQTMRQDRVQHEDWAHSRSTAALDQGFLNGDVAPSRLGRVVGDDHFGPATVYQRTYPAGVVSMHGNTGGAGSYLTFVGNPTAPTAPCVSVFEWALPSDWSISATSSWDANYQPDRIKVHDGNPWHSGRENILPQDLFFDAGQEVTLSGFATAHPIGWAGSAMQGYTLSRSDDGVNFIEIVSGTGTNLANSERQEFEFDAVTSQHWRLHMASNYGYHNLVTAQYVEFRSETCVQ